MAIEVQLFDGTVLEFPEGTDQAVIDRVAKQETTLRQPPQEEPGLLDRIGTGAERLATSFGTGIAGIVGSEEQAAAAAQAGAAEQERISQEAGPTRGFGEVAAIYEREGILPAAGEFLSQIPGAVAEQVPQIGGTLAAGAAGAKVGTVVGGPAGGVIGGVLGSGAYLFPQMFGSNLEEQARVAQEEGRELDLERGRAALAATGQTAVESVGLAYTLGGNLVRRIVGSEASKEIAERKLLEAAQSSLAGGAARGAARGTSEVPVEVAQEVLNRWQSGQDLFSDEAIENYGASAYGALQVGPTIGAAASPFERGAARSALAQRGLTPEGEAVQQEVSEKRKAQLRQEQQTASYMREVEQRELEERQQREEAQRIQNAQEAQSKVDELGNRIDEITIEPDGLTDRLDALYGVKDNLQILKDTVGKDKVTGDVRKNLNERLRVVNAKIKEGQDLAKTIGVEPVRRARVAKEAVKNLPADRRAAEVAKIFTAGTPEQGVFRAVGEPQVVAETTVEPDLKLTKQELLDVGLPESAGYTKQLAKLDLAVPDDRTKAAEIIGRAVENPRVKPEVKTALQNLYQSKLATPTPETQQALPFDREPDTTPSTVVSDATFDELGIGRTAVLRKNKDVVGLDYSSPENAQFLRNVFEAYRDAPNRSEPIKEKIDAFLAQLPEAPTRGETDVAPTTPTVEPTIERPTGEPSVAVADVGDGTAAPQEGTPGGVAESGLGGLADTGTGVTPDVGRGEQVPGAVTETAPVETAPVETAPVETAPVETPTVDDALAALGSPVPDRTLPGDTRADIPRRERADFGRALGASGQRESELRGRKSPEMSRAIMQGDIKKVLDLLAKSKNPITARIGELGKKLTGLRIIADETARETQDVSRQYDREIGSAKMNLALLDMAREAKPLVDAAVGNELPNLSEFTTEVAVYDPNLDALRPVVMNLRQYAGETKESFARLLDNLESGIGRQEATARAYVEMSTKRMVIPASYDQASNTIRVNLFTDFNGKLVGVEESIIAHEVAHALTLDALQKPSVAQRPAVKRLQTLFDTVKNDPLIEDAYGGVSLEEFVAEGFGNPEFQLRLSRIKYENTSALGKFAQYIANLLGLKADNAFTEFLSLVEGIADRKPSKTTKATRAPEAPPTVTETVPVETPTVETPTVETPTVETPTVETAPVETAPTDTQVLDIGTAVTEAQTLADRESTDFRALSRLARSAYNSGLIPELKYQSIARDIADRDPFTASNLYDTLLSEQSGNDVANAVSTLRASGDMAGSVTPELESALNAGDVRGALRAMLDNDTAAFTDTEQLIAKRILDLSARVPTLRMVDSLGVDKNGNPILGQYNSITDEISLVRGTADSHTFLHELTHAYVHRTIIEQQQTGARRPAFKDLQDVFNHLKENNPELAKEYGMTSLTEFASEVMSNPEFQMKLMGIEYKRVSVFTWFARALQKLMGIGDTDPVNNTLFASMVAVEGLMHTGRELQIAQTGKPLGGQDIVNVTTQAKQNVDTPLGQPLPRTLAEVNRASDQVVRTELNKFAHSYANNETGFGTIFRQQAFDILAPVAKKLNTAFSEGVKNSFGDVNPLAYMRQAFDHQRIALQVFRAGGLRMTKDGFWEAFDLKDNNGKSVSAEKIVETIRDFAKKEGTGYSVMKGRIATVLEGMRLKDLREHNAKIEAEAKKLAAQGDLDGAFELRQDKLYLHKTNAEIDALVDIFNKTPEIQEVQRVMNAVRGNLIEAMVKSGRITQDKADAWRAAVNYVPFDRLKEIGDNPEIIFGTGRRGIAALARLPEFDGSLDRPVANTIDNFMNKIAWMTEQSMRNSAVTRALNTMVDAGFARKLQSRGQAQNTHLLLTMFEGGEPVFYELQNEYDLAAFLQSPEPNGAVMNAFSGASRLLRTTVTATPMFAIKQVIDDAQRVMFYSGVKSPLSALGRTLINLPRILFIQNFGKNKQVVENLERLGVVGDYDFNPINPAETLELDTKARQRSPVRALIHAMEKVTKASDMAARLAVYEQTMKESGDITLAHNRARELINFNRRGASKFMRAMTHIVPFFNSWAQGTDLMYRGFTGEDASSGVNRRAARNMFISRIAFMTGMGFLYASLMSEDEGYQETSDDVRDRAWVLPKQFSDAFGMSQPFKIPVPIELGFLFKSIPERTVQYMNEHAKEENQPALKVVLDTFRDAAAVYGMEPIPAILRPAMENLTNYSFFNHRALVPPSLQNAPKELQFTSSTSEFAKSLGKQTSTSPILIDNAMRGYFGMMWSSSSVMIDAMMNPTRPDRNMNQLPFLSIGLMAPVGTRTKDEFYEFREKVTAAVNGRNRLATDPERQQEFIIENQGLLAAAPYVNQKLKQLRTLRSMKKLYESPVANMTGEQRREMLNEASRIENDILSDIREVRNRFMSDK